MAKPKIGLHGGAGIGMNGITDRYIMPILNSGIPVHIKSVDNVGFAVDVLRRSEAAGVASQVVMRWVGGFPDNPDYDGKGTPEQVMDAYYDMYIRPKLQANPELAVYKDRVWIELLNEPDKNRWATVCRWAKQGITRLNQDGWRGAAIAANAGEPEPEHWAIPEALDLLRFIARSPDQRAISLHEGFGDFNIYETPASELYPFLIGRVSWLNKVATDNGIEPPTVFVSELAWSYEDMPPYGKAMQDVEFYGRTYNDMPNIKGAFLWNLTSGWDTLPQQLNGMFEILAEYAHTDLPDVGVPPIEPPPTDCPNLGYTIVYNLYHQQSVTDAEYAEIATHARAAGFQTVTGSADDAANMVSRGKPPTPADLLSTSLGVPKGTRVTVWNPERWPDDIDLWLYDKGVKQIEHRYVRATTPPPTGWSGWEWPVRAPSNEQSSDGIPGWWYQTIKYAQLYTLSANNTKAYHTGSDLNKEPADYGLEFYSPADGVVVFSRMAEVWGKVLVIRHDDPAGSVWTRFAHMKDVYVGEGSVVKKGQAIGTVGDGEGVFGAHLHHDVSHSGILQTNPLHWPKLDQQAVFDNYKDPVAFYGAKGADVITLPPTTGGGSGSYTGPPVFYVPHIHGPGDDWMWNNAGLRSMMESLKNKGMAVKYLSNGINSNFASSPAPAHHMVRMFWKPDKYKTPAQAWTEDIRDGVMAFYARGYRDFEVHNEPNLTQEGLGVVWDTGAEFGAWVSGLVDIAKAEMPQARFWFPGMSPGVPWTNQFTFSQPAWVASKAKFYGACLHAYTGEVADVNKAADEIVRQVEEAQRFMFLDKPLFISEVSVNRAAPASFKAQVYMRVDQLLKNKQGIKGVAYFVSHWQGSPEHEENWLGTDLPNLYNVT